jgi:hypothetical protein
VGGHSGTQRGSPSGAGRFAFLRSRSAETAGWLERAVLRSRRSLCDVLSLRGHPPSRADRSACPRRSSGIFRSAGAQRPRTGRRRDPNPPEPERAAVDRRRPRRGRCGAEASRVSVVGLEASHRLSVPPAHAPLDAVTHHQYLALAGLNPQQTEAASLDQGASRRLSPAARLSPLSLARHGQSPA